MNTCERFLATMNFEVLDRPLYWEFGYWISTIRRWYTEGLKKNQGVSEHLDDDATLSGEVLGINWRNPNFAVDVNIALGFDEPIYRIPVNNLYCPAFEVRRLDDNPEWYTIQNSDGEIVRISKLNGSCHFLEFPVKTREDYYRLREERFQPNLTSRLPADWATVKEKLKKRTFPLMYGGNLGFFNHPRRLVGAEHLLTFFYDDPELLREMINDTCEFIIRLYEPLLNEIGGDCAMISEDMCYKSGCFISPPMFREFLMPAYQRLTEFYRSHGIKVIYVDCDGDVTKLIPLLIEGGVTGLHPFEVTEDCDITKIRAAFPKFQIMGGLDKKKVALGRAAIDEELDRKVPALLKGGGFIPFIDHTVPPDISWQDFCYYRNKLREYAK